MKSNKGITLVALVITVIILIILAGVSVSIITGDNGIATKSKEAANQYKKSEVKERLEIALLRIAISYNKVLNENNLRAVLDDEFGQGGYNLQTNAQTSNYEVTFDDFNFTISQTGEVIDNSSGSGSGGNVQNQYEIGSTVKLGEDEEEFYVIGSDSTTLTLLSAKCVTNNGNYTQITRTS